MMPIVTRAKRNLVVFTSNSPAIVFWFANTVFAYPPPGNRLGGSIRRVFSQILLVTVGP